MNPYPYDPTGLAFWLTWGIAGALWEVVASFSGHRNLTLSYQVWSFGSHEPGWVRDMFIALCGLAATTLVVHFFGRFTVGLH